MNVKNAVYGAIIGDVAGSRFEFNPIKNKNFDLFYSFSGKGYDVNQTLEDYFKSSKFTDDTVMTIAVSNALIEANGDYSNLREIVVKNLKYFGRKYPYRGYGSKFQQWLNWDLNKPYNSFGNGSAMRISAVPYFANSKDEVKRLSKMVTDVTHNHPEGIKGAEAVAVSIWMALHIATARAIELTITDFQKKIDESAKQVGVQLKETEKEIMKLKEGVSFERGFRRFLFWATPALLLVQSIIMIISILA